MAGQGGAGDKNVLETRREKAQDAGRNEGMRGGNGWLPAEHGKGARELALRMHRQHGLFAGDFARDFQFAAQNNIEIVFILPFGKESFALGERNLFPMRLQALNFVFRKPGKQLFLTGFRNHGITALSPGTGGQTARR